MSRIFWDTNLFIYLFEGHAREAERVARIHERMVERNDELCTSALTLGEVLVKPLERGEEALARRYEDTLLREVLVVPFDSGAARSYANIRRDRAIRPPDAIQLACAAQAGVELFLTNDDRLSRCRVPGIHFIAPLDRAFL